MSIQYTDDDLVSLGFQKDIFNRDFMIWSDRAILRLIAHNSQEINLCVINYIDTPYTLPRFLTPQTIDDIRYLAAKVGITIPNDPPSAWSVTFDWPRMTEAERQDCYRFICVALGHLITTIIVKPEAMTPEAQEAMRAAVAEIKPNEGPWVPMGNHCDVRFNPDDLWPRRES